MKDEPSKRRIDYKKAWASASNRFTAEFIDDLCNEDGSIDWEKLVEFNSGVNKPSKSRRAVLLRKHQKQGG
ncbi:MAG: hypothetical protein ACE5K8_03360 [Candidatus Zixiibacteriota bacterium]